MRDSLLIFGPPGVGKGTQSSYIAERYNLVHISAGDLFREVSKEKGAQGDLARRIITEGSIDADEFTAGLVREAIVRAPNRKYIIDGFPRTVSQIAVADGLFQEQNVYVGTSIYLHVDDETAYNRVIRRALTTQDRRLDDTTRIAREKIRVYNEQTVPAIEAMCARGNMISINALSDAESVRDAIFERLDQLV